MVGKIIRIRWPDGGVVEQLLLGSWIESAIRKRGKVFLLKKLRVELRKRPKQ
jgi:hypothetical protein